MNKDQIVYEYVENGKSINRIAKENHCSWNKIKKVLDEKKVTTFTQRNQYGVIESVSDLLFRKIEDSDSAYWLGFMYADGSIRLDRNEISLELQERDYETILQFHNYCKNKNKIHKHSITRNNKTYISYNSSFSSKQVKENLIKLGCTPKKSLVLTFPTEQQVPSEYLLDFVRGYIDGDGYVQFDYSKSRYRICILGTLNFLEGLINRTGWKEKSKIYKDGNIFKLELTGKELVRQKLIDLYENSKYHLDRKYLVYKQAKLGA